MIVNSGSIFCVWGVDLCNIFVGYSGCLRYFCGNVYLDFYGFSCGYWIIFCCYINCVIFYVKDFLFCLNCDGIFDWNWWFFYVCFC